MMSVMVFRGVSHFFPSEMTPDQDAILEDARDTFSRKDDIVDTHSCAPTDLGAQLMAMRTVILYIKRLMTLSAYEAAATVLYQQAMEEWIAMAVMEDDKIDARAWIERVRAVLQI